MLTRGGDQMLQLFLIQRSRRRHRRDCACRGSCKCAAARRLRPPDCEFVRQPAAMVPREAAFPVAGVTFQIRRVCSRAVEKLPGHRTARAQHSPKSILADAGTIWLVFPPAAGPPSRNIQQQRDFPVKWLA